MAGLVVTVLAAYSAVTLALRVCGDPVTAALQLLLPWTGVLTFVTTATAIAFGNTPLAMAGGVTSVIVSAVLIPRLRRASPPEAAQNEPTFNIALANLYIDNPDPAEAIRQLIDPRPDVIVMTELTDELRAVFDRVADGTYRRRVHPEPLDGEYEPGIFIADDVDVTHTAIDTVGPLRTIEAAANLGGREVRIVTVHPVAPTDRGAFRQWRAELGALRQRLDNADGPTVVLGDLNAGTLQVPYENVTRGNHFRDAHDLLGVALRPSWGIAPGLPRWVPTLVARLDHLLVSPEIVVHELTDLDAVGSDHRPFIAALSIRPEA